MEGQELSLVIVAPEQGQFLTRIEWNREELLSAVRSAMERYQGVTFTEEQVKDAKAERARLNALKKAIADRRVQIKNAIMAPYAQFETEVKEIVALIDGPIDEIDRQVKAYEKGQKAEKKTALREHFEKLVADMEFKPTFEQVFDPRYLNVSVTLTKAKKDLSDKVERVRRDLRTVQGVEEEYRLVVLDAYGKTLDISFAMNEMNRLKELKRQEDERKAREAERRAAEEAAREAAIGQARNGVAAPMGSSPVTEGNRPADNGQLTMDALSRQRTQSEEVSRTAERQSVSAPPAQDPFDNPPKPKRYKASFTVYGSMEQILSVKQFLTEHEIRFEKGVSK